MVFDRERVDRYSRMTTGRPLAGDEVPPLALSMAINTLATTYHPSPPGSIHARQRFSILEPVRVDVPTVGRVRRGDDRVRKGRTYVRLEFELEQHGVTVVWAESQTLWAGGAAGDAAHD